MARFINFCFSRVYVDSYGDFVPDPLSTYGAKIFFQAEAREIVVLLTRCCGPATIMMNALLFAVVVVVCH